MCAWRCFHPTKSWRKSHTESTDPDSYPYSEMQVTLRRYLLEVETLCSQMEQFARARRSSDPAYSPVVFFDGSLVVSFALTMPSPYRERYIAAAVSLLHTSEELRVPLIGYIDTSYARDMITMLRRLDTMQPDSPRCAKPKDSRCAALARPPALGRSHARHDLRAWRRPGRLWRLPRKRGLLLPANQRATHHPPAWNFRAG